MKQIGHELGVHYVLEGSVRRVGKKVRITAQLIDAVADHHVWAQRFDADVEDIFDVQDEITEQITMAVGPEIQVAEIERARRRKLPELDVWQLHMRARGHLANYTVSDSAEAEALLLRALELDQQNGDVLAALGECYAWDGFYGWHRPQPASMAMAVEMANKAMAVDPRNETVHVVLGGVLFGMKKHADAIRRLETAIQLNPNNSQAIGFLGMVLVFLHQSEEATKLLDKAIRLSPRDPMRAWYVTYFGVIEFLAGRYESAIGWFHKAADINPNLPTIHRGLAASNGILGTAEGGTRLIQ